MINYNSALHFQHIFWKEQLKESHVVVDATCGNGHDTAYLLEHSSDDVILYAIDIQEKPISMTKETVSALSCKGKQVYYCNGSHDIVIRDLQEKTIDLVVFNLGYLPGASHTLMTHEKTTIGALNEAMKKLSPKGLITIVAYPGTEAGQIEMEAVSQFLQSMNQQEWDISCWSPLNQKKNPPALFIIKGR